MGHRFENGWLGVTPPPDHSFHMKLLHWTRNWRAPTRRPVGDRIIAAAELVAKEGKTSWVACKEARLNPRSNRASVERAAERMRHPDQVKHLGRPYAITAYVTVLMLDWFRTLASGVFPTLSKICEQVPIPPRGRLQSHPFNHQDAFLHEDRAWHQYGQGLTASQLFRQHPPDRASLPHSAPSPPPPRSESGVTSTT
jgi:hypothetical protein